MSLLCLRYIDDTLMLWKGTKAKLKTLIHDLNEKNKTIKLHFQISPRKIAFLDAIFYTKTKITTSKQLSIENLQINLHSYTLKYHIFMTSKKNVQFLHPIPLFLSVRMGPNWARPTHPPRDVET